MQKYKELLKLQNKFQKFFIKNLKFRYIDDIILASLVETVISESIIDNEH